MFPPAIAVGGLVQGHSIEPCLQAGFSPELVDFPMEGQENLLGDIHRFGLVSQRMGSQVVDQILVELKHLLEGGVVPFLEANHQVFRLMEADPGGDGTGELTHNITPTEFGYLDDVTSAIQTQINSKQDTVAYVSDTEIGYLNGVTSSIQDQIDAAGGGSAPLMTFTSGYGQSTYPYYTLSGPSGGYFFCPSAISGSNHCYIRLPEFGTMAQYSFFNIYNGTGSNYLWVGSYDRGADGTTTVTDQIIHDKSPDGSSGTLRGISSSQRIAKVVLQSTTDGVEKWIVMYRG